MILGPNTEAIFQNLYVLIKQTQLLVDGLPTGGPAFETTGRKLPQVSNVSGIQQPAFYQLEGEQDVLEKAIALAKYEMHAAAVILFRNTGGDAGIPSQQMNSLRDAVIFQLQQQTLAPDGLTVIALPGGLRQTLGGVVYHARVKGRILMNEGLQNNQGAIVFPISILSGM
jgi:hypothetical protein